MNIQKGREGIEKLSPTSKRRLKHYRAKLAESKDAAIFDPRMREYLIYTSEDGGERVRRVNAQLDSIRWNQSTFKPESIVEQCQRFTLPDRPNRAWKRRFVKVKKDLIAAVKAFKLKMLSYNTQSDIVNALPRTDTHPGFSAIETGLWKKGDYTEGLLANYLAAEHKAKLEGSFNRLILIGNRTQSKVPYSVHDGSFIFEGDCYRDWLRTRMVSMIDIIVILAECKFAIPFQKAIARTDWYMGGKNDSYIHYLIGRKREQFKYWYSLDYSSYDQTIPAWLIREAFDVIRESFDERHFDNRLFEVVREDFIHKVFVTADDLVESHKGVPSGSMFTQIIDSIVNIFMIKTYLEKKGITRSSMLIMGDDNLVFVSEQLNLEELSEYLYKEFGIIMNHTKVDSGTTASDNPLFLSREWTPFGVFRQPEIIIAKLLFPERRREYDRYGFTPDMVLQSYWESFPLGMERFLNKGKHDKRVHQMQDEMSASKWLSGLARYRLLYAS